MGAPQDAEDKEIATAEISRALLQMVLLILLHSTLSLDFNGIVTFPICLGFVLNHDKPSYITCKSQALCLPIIPKSCETFSQNGRVDQAVLHLHFIPLHQQFCHYKRPKTLELDFITAAIFSRSFIQITADSSLIHQTI